MNVPNSYVVKERWMGHWHNTYCDNKNKAKKLCNKILAKGGKAVWMKNTI